MSIIDEKLTEQFYDWEQRGRGWKVFDESVALEPPFRPFYGHYLPKAVPLEDGRRHTFLSSLIDYISRRLRTEPGPTLETSAEDQEPEPTAFTRDRLVEIATSLPAKLDIGPEPFAHFLRSLGLCREPVGIEIVSTAGSLRLQFVAGKCDESLLSRQLLAYFPEATFQSREGALKQAWDDCTGEEMLVVEFGLEREFMFQLATGKLDPYVGVFGALSKLESSDLGLFQVLFQPVQKKWADSIVHSVAHDDGRPFFVNQPELLEAAENKVRQPLYATVVRIATKGSTFERALELACDLAGSLRVFAKPQGNELIPLTNERYPFYQHIEDVFCRQSRRSGMLLNSDELVGLVHLPGSVVRSSELERDAGKTKAAPMIARNPTGLLLGSNSHLGESTSIRLTREQRTRHCHMIGVSGTGKSTLLFNLIRQDIQNGEGVAVLDPHGDLVDRILGIIPSQRIQDVVLVDPSDEQYSVGFNILSAHSELEKTLLASDLVSVFQRLSTSWGDQMQSVLQNAIRAFLNSSRGGTLADLRRFLIEPGFRNEFLKSVSDSGVLYYWHKGFAQLTGNKSVGPVLTRLETLLAQKPIEHMVSQPTNRLDFGNIMDSGKIFLAKLPEGLLGKENSYLIGALLISKFQQLAMSRQAKQVAARRDYWMYIDEFANFITPTMAEILSGARKYRIGLTLAHHELHQLHRNSDVASAVMAHPFTRVVFRVGDDDAKKLAEGFTFFEAKDFKNLEAGHAIARVERSNFDFNLSIPLPEQIDEGLAAERREEVIKSSREKYSTPRAEIEAQLLKTWNAEQAEAKSTKSLKSASDKAKTALSNPKESFEEEKSGEISAPANRAAAPDILRKTDLAGFPGTVLPKEDSPGQGAEQKIAEILELANSVDKVVSIPQKDKTSAAPRELGRGSPEHKDIQKQIKDAAEALNFRSIIEHKILDGENYVDVWLERNGDAIACEVSLESPLSWEVDKVAKFIKADLKHVAMVSTNPAQLEKLSRAIENRVGLEASKRIQYYSPSQFIESLRTIEPSVPSMSGQFEIRRGRKVVRKFTNISPKEAAQREEGAIRELRAKMKTKSD
jgi:hypothetical protein